MSYRRKNCWRCFCHGIIHDGSGRLYRDKEQYWQCCSSEIEINAEETSAQSEAGTFQVQICLLSGIWQEPMRRVGQFMSHFPMMVSQGKRMALQSMDRR